MSNPAVKILTVCKQGLVRSVALTDVLKLHFEPVDVIPLGLSSNSISTFEMLAPGNWADWCIVMDKKRYDWLAKCYPYSLDMFRSTLLLCDVGPDTYGDSHNKLLIDKVWRWARENSAKMGIAEHTKRL